MNALQRTPEWLAARAGRLTASRLPLAIARTKSGWGASRANLMAELLVERITGQPVPSYESAAMAWGTENEPFARAAYEFYRDVTVDLVGFIEHPRIAMAGCSPDGVVGADGLVEFKCPNSATHIETLLSKRFDGRYLTQCQWQLATTGCKWVDLTSFDPRMPEHLRLFVLRIERDDDYIAELESLAEDFLRELAEKVMRLGALAA